MSDIGEPLREHEITPLVEPIPRRDVPALPPVHAPEPIMPEYVPEPSEPLVPA